MHGGARAVARCDALGVPPYSDRADGLFRGYLSPAYLAAQDRLAEWMRDAGMTVRRDAAGNLVGRYDGTHAEERTLVIGSHLDSVRDAGRYDGPLGIMLGVECVAALHARGRRMHFAIEVYAFGDEEGSRFPAAMLTSRAVAGTLDPATLDTVDADGVALADALRTAGLDVARFGEARHARALAYLEAHIEQGPALEAAGTPVGVVTGIAAQLRYRLTFHGVAGHAGTTAMPLRRDALAAAAELVLAAEHAASGGSADLVATVGMIQAEPGAANVIPGRVVATLDVRALDPHVRDATARAILAAGEAAATRRGVTLTVEPIHDLPASPCDPTLTGLLAAAMQEAGQRDTRLASGAGHDAMVMAALCPTAMLFVRCRGGVSHNPAEHVDPADADVALRVMLGFIERLGACA
ncbi:MAG: allantoate amidohydrolase [Sphingomonas taxi]|uniref:Allantoate amidohydrolase n=1 Tax=Sphingomonas taxi TaxID=1549858 RepID=A0A2W5P445_9SPHN|nr:MAG: allantoate amidohydrolase [Sphingomonas taxi]